MGNVSIFTLFFCVEIGKRIVWLNVQSVLVTIGQLLVMASLAEYYSLWPSAGGQQFYTQVSIPRR